MIVYWILLYILMYFKTLNIQIYSINILFYETDSIIILLRFLLLFRKFFLH